jgi:hypothetical protein
MPGTNFTAACEAVPPEKSRKAGDDRRGTNTAFAPDPALVFIRPIWVCQPICRVSGQETDIPARTGSVGATDPGRQVIGPANAGHSVTIPR